MRTIQIEDRDYEAIAAAYGDFKHFVKEQAAKARRKSPADAPANFQDAATQSGFFPGGADGLPADLSTNPKHLEGFGQ